MQRRGFLGVLLGGGLTPFYGELKELPSKLAHIKKFIECFECDEKALYDFRLVVLNDGGSFLSPRPNKVTRDFGNLTIKYGFGDIRLDRKMTVYGFYLVDGNGYKVSSDKTIFNFVVDAGNTLNLNFTQRID